MLFLLDLGFFQLRGQIPTLGDIWWLVFWIPGLASAVAALLAGGHSLVKRISLGVLTGTIIGLIYTLTNATLTNILPDKAAQSLLQALGQAAVSSAWMIIFLFAFTALVGSVIVETRPLPRPEAHGTH